MANKVVDPVRGQKHRGLRAGRDKAGRDVGNVFVFAANTADSMLVTLPGEDFHSHLGKLGRLLG